MKLTKQKRESIEAYLETDDHDERAPGWWLTLDPKGRLEVQRAVLLRALRTLFVQLGQLGLRMSEAMALKHKANSTTLKNISIAQGVTMDKVAELEKQITDLEAKLGSGRKVRPKNSHKKG